MILLLLLFIGVMVVACAGESTQSQSGTAKTMRCPTCGAQATVRGNSWECGWCGDCGVFR